MPNGLDNPNKNCKSLGYVLIAREICSDLSVPDENAEGGNTTFEFTAVVEYVGEIGLLDVDDETSNIVTCANDATMATTVPVRGDTS